MTQKFIGFSVISILLLIVSCALSLNDQLINASLRGMPTNIEILLKKGADVNVKAKAGCSVT